MSTTVASTALILSKEDKHSPVWLRHKEQLEARLEVLRARNDSFLNDEETAILRGRIAEIKLMLGLSKDQPPDFEY